MDRWFINRNNSLIPKINVFYRTERSWMVSMYLLANRGLIPVYRRTFHIIVDRYILFLLSRITSFINLTLLNPIFELFLQHMLILVNLRKYGLISIIFKNIWILVLHLIQLIRSLLSPLRILHPISHVQLKHFNGFKRLYSLLLHIFVILVIIPKFYVFQSYYIFLEFINCQLSSFNENF